MTAGYFHGSVFVTMNARKFLESVSFVISHIYNTQRDIDYLQNSTFLADVEHIVDCFDKTTKLKFRNSDDLQYIKFGAARDNDQSCNIRFGQLKLLGSDVAKFFELSVECIVNAVIEQCRMAHKPIAVCFFCFCWLCFALNLHSSMLFSLVDSPLVTGYPTRSTRNCSRTA